MHQLIMTADQLPDSHLSPDLAKLEFSYNWNKKLDCSSYTTLRLANAGKYRVGRKFGVYLNGKRIHDAEVIDVKTLTLDKISEWMARLDTGYARAECIELIQKMYKNQAIQWETQALNLILLRKLEH